MIVRTIGLSQKKGPILGPSIRNPMIYGSIFVAPDFWKLSCELRSTLSDKPKGHGSYTRTLIAALI